jgi:hypothetical protein
MKTFIEYALGTIFAIFLGVLLALVWLGAKGIYTF